MGEHAEVAGCIQIKILYSENEVNKWLSENAEVEVVDIKITGLNTYDCSDESIMIIYRKDEPCEEKRISLP
ncbi:hypothetical protein [Fictibacillus sp. JL2B1089]|uniref:hypothetical protein n=1 Tax=Fictibacillus sp. JL2B1089 TaxID=3399565 RepID=UPI003A8684C2